MAATEGDPERKYPWPGQWDPARCNSYESRLNRTTTVGIYPNGATKQEVMDMAGNVWEWCFNEYEEPGTPRSVPSENDEQVQRVTRGGSWSDTPGFLCSSTRGRAGADNCDTNIGFRLAQDIE